MTIRQMARAIAAETRQGLRYLVSNRVVCRELDGGCLQGLLVDRTTPGQYTLWAATDAWFSVVDHPVLTLSFRFRQHERFGDHTQVAEQLSPYLDTDPELCRVVFAGPEHPVFLHPSLSYWGGPLLAMRGQLRNEPNTSYYDRRRRAVEELLHCIASGAEPRSVIEPWSQAARASLKIEPVARMRLKPGPERPADLA